jgi:aromatic-L-amino-acid decarboxylase
MTPEEFRQAGHALIDWIADYRADLEQRPVRAQVKPGEIRANFPRQAPEEAAGAM